MNDNTTNDERFKTISGISYETKIKELYDICKEKKEIMKTIKKTLKT